MLSRTVEVNETVKRVVCVGPGALRFMVYLNATDMVVGVEEVEKTWDPAGRPYIMANPELAELPTIGKGGPGNPNPYPEEILKVNPDVIFAAAIDEQLANSLQQQTGAPVLVLDYGPVKVPSDKFFESLRLAGKVIGKEQRAEEVISFINGLLADLSMRTANISDESKPTVYVGGLGYQGTQGIESTECQFSPFVAVNAKNVVDELTQTAHVFIDKEKLLEWNPDIIFIDEAGAAMVSDDYSKNPDFYNSLKAFINGNVYGVLPYNYYWTNVGTTLADAYYIGKVLYSDRFADVDPEAKADDIYAFLVGKPVYDEMEEAFGGFKLLNFG